MLSNWLNVMKVKRVDFVWGAGSFAVRKGGVSERVVGYGNPLPHWFEK